MSARSSPSSSSAISMGEYAPSPNTCSIALLRANQLRVQTLLRQLLVPNNNNSSNNNNNINDNNRTDKEQQQQSTSTANINRQRVDVLRVLRRTLRELDFELSWLTQVDFFETLERILLDDEYHASCSSSASVAADNYVAIPDNWRLIDDATKLLIEAIPRFRFDIEQQTLANILASVIQNLGHQRSEVRRSSLLLINMYLQERPQEFQQFLRLFIEYGLANHRNEQAQRGAILSLPLLMSEQVVEGEDLLPLIRCLSELLIDSANSRLFYSLFLALQRLHLTIGDQKFASYLSGCSPEAMMLYRQAASRSNSLAVNQQQQQPETTKKSNSRLNSTQENSSNRQREQIEQQQQQQQQQQEEPSKQVTFETDTKHQDQPQQQRRQSQVRHQAQQEKRAEAHSSSAEDTSHGSLIGEIEDETAAAATVHQTNDGNNPLPIEPPGGSISGVSESSTEQTTERFNQNYNNSNRKQQSKNQMRVYSSVSSTCSSEANLVDPSHYMSEAALSGRPLSGFEQIHHIDHSSTGLAINDLGICCTPTMELGPGAENELKFGIFPKHLVWVTLRQNARIIDRLDAMQELMCIVRDSPINHLAILMTYFDSFLEQFIGRLLEPGTDYKLELCAIDMIETIVIKTKLSTIQYVRPIVNLLARTIGDSRQVFRDNTVRVLHKMMAYLPPQHVIDALFEHKHHRQSSVREECINRVTAAVLEYDRQEFNLTKLCYHVLPMLADHHASVRLAALECIAALANALGQERIGSLLTAAEAVQTGCDYDGLLDAIHARLMRRTLPRCHSDGSIGYVIKPFLNLANASHHQEHQAADVRWILEAPSSHQHVGGEHHHHVALGPPMHHAHRSGVYSPPPADVKERAQQMRRRSSLTHLLNVSSTSSSNESMIANEPHRRKQQQQQHHHHHHHHHHHPQHNHNHHPTSTTETNASDQRRQQQQTTSAANDDDETIEQEQPTKLLSSAATNRKQSRSEASNRSEAHRRTSSLAKQPTKTATESEIMNDGANKTPPIEHEAQITHCSQDGDRKYSDHRLDNSYSSSSNVSRKRNKSHGKRRSNSQDSAASSSSDTNKVLFQYYLGKFKQSLNNEFTTTNGVTGTTNKGINNNNNNNTAAVLLPSDSLIYTDTDQAFASTQHQTRQQQTSFDYDTDSVGQIPTPTTIREKKSRSSKQSRQKQTTSSSSNSKNCNEDNHHQNLAQMSREETAAAAAAAAAANEMNSMAAANAGSSGNESPQTVIEQHRTHQRRQSSTQDISHLKAEESIQQKQQQQQNEQNDISAAATTTKTTPTTRDRRKSLAKQRASELGMSRDNYNDADADDNDDLENIHNRTASGQTAATPAVTTSCNRQRSNSEKLARDDRDCNGAATRSTGRPSTRKVELQRQCASMVADYAPSGADYDVSSSSRDHANERDDDPMKPVEAGGGGRDEPIGAEDRRREEQARSSRARSTTRRSSQARAVAGDEEAPAAGDGDHTDQQQQQQVEDSNQQEREIRRRASRSQPPSRHSTGGSTGSSNHELIAIQLEQLDHLQQQQQPQHQQHLRNHTTTRRSVSVSPSLASSVNIRHILENVADIEGPFQDPHLALKVSMEALEGPCWSTKVEGMLAIIRLASYHQQVVAGHLHELISHTANETRNLRSTVARSAIFTLGDLCAKLKRSVEPELDLIVQSLLNKSIENTAFIRDDIRKAFSEMVEHLTQWRLANSLIHHGANHKNVHVRRMASQFIAQLVDRMGAAKCLVGARDISTQLIPAVARFAQDNSPQTRYYGRLMLLKIMYHGAFERLLRKNLSPNLYRSTIGIIESVKRRGVGDPPAEN